MSEKPNDEWLEVRRNVNESVVLYRYRGAIDPAISFEEYPTLVAVTWEFADYDDPFKFQGSVDEHHNDLEQSLDHMNDGEHAVLVLVRTGKEVKEWVWYVRNFEEWLVNLNKSFSGKPAFPIKIDPYEDPEWGTFKQLCEMGAQ